MTEHNLTLNDSGIHDSEVERIFGDSGLLSASIQGYRSRQAQIEMAQAIAQAIAGQKTLLAEAGTGTGKTFAYLIPALLWGGKVIVSTGTKNLQDQLYLRDIPTIKKSFKGASLCRLIEGACKLSVSFPFGTDIAKWEINHERRCWLSA